jgi:hypothetical protein
MSLIVDINPVPWEILDLVRARILKNRAKKQKRQPEKPEELRRVMQVDNGILAKQRWEEPSFIGGDRIPFFAVVIHSEFTYTKISLVFNGEPVTTPSFEFLTPGNYIFAWSAGEQDYQIISETVNLFYSASRAFNGLPDYPLLNWITVEMNTNEPKRNGPSGNDFNLIITLRDQLDFFVAETIPSVKIYQLRAPSPLGIFYGDVQDIETGGVNALKFSPNPLPQIFTSTSDNTFWILEPQALVGESRRSYLDFYVDG